MDGSTAGRISHIITDTTTTGASPDPLAPDRPSSSSREGMMSSGGGAIMASTTATPAESNWVSVAAAVLAMVWDCLYALICLVLSTSSSPTSSPRVEGSPTSTAPASNGGKSEGASRGMMDDYNSKPPEVDGPREANGGTNAEGDRDRNGGGNLAGDPENENENEKAEGGGGEDEAVAAIEKPHEGADVDGREWQNKSSSSNAPRRRLVREGRHGTSEFFEYMRHGYEKSQAAAAAAAEAATPSEAEAETKTKAEVEAECDGDRRAKGLPSPTSPSSLSTPALLPSRRRSTLTSSSPSSASSSACSSPSPPSSPVVGTRSLSPPGLRREKRTAKSAKKGGGNGSPGPTLRKSAGDEASPDATATTTATVAVPTLKRSQSSLASCSSKSSSDGTTNTSVDTNNVVDSSGNDDTVDGGERKRGTKGRKVRAKEESDAAAVGVRLHVRSDEIEVPKQRAAAGFKLNLDGIWRHHHQAGGGGVGALTPTQESFYNHLRQGAMTRSVSAETCQGSESARAPLAAPPPPPPPSTTKEDDDARAKARGQLRASSPGPGGRETRAQSHPIAASTSGGLESSCANHNHSMLSLSLADYLRDDNHSGGSGVSESTQQPQQPQEKPSKPDRDREEGSLRGSARKLITTTGGKFYGKLRSKGSFIAPRRKECDAVAAALPTGPAVTQDDQSISPRRGRPADALLMSASASASTTSLCSPSAAAAASFARSPAVSVPSFAPPRGRRGLSVGNRHDGFGSGDEVDEALAAAPFSKSVDEVIYNMGRHQQPRGLGGDASPAVNVVAVAPEERVEADRSLSGSGRRRHRTLLHVSSPSSPTLGARSSSAGEATGPTADPVLSSYGDECADEGDAGSRRKRDALRGLMKKGIKPLGKTASLVGSRIKSRSPLRMNNCSQSSDALVDSRSSTIVCGSSDSGDFITCSRGLYDDVVLFGGDDAGGGVDGLDTSVPLVADDRGVGSMDDDALAAATSDSEVSSALLGSSFSPVPSPPSRFMSTPASPIAPLRRSEPGASGGGGSSGSSPPLHSAFHLSSLSPPGYSEFSLHTAQGSLPVPIPLTALLSQSPSPVPSSPSGSPPQQHHQLHPSAAAAAAAAAAAGGLSSPSGSRTKNEKRLSRGYSPLTFWRKGGSTAACHTSSDRIMDARGATGDSSDSGFGGGGAVSDSAVGSSRQSSADDVDADTDDLQTEYQLSQQALRIEVVETEEQQKQHQELLAKLEEMQWRLLSGEGGFERQSRRTKLHKIHSCFRATELVTWILCDLGLQSRAEAAAVARDLMKENMLHHATFQITDFIDGQSFYRLQWDSRVAEACLNMRKIWAFPPRNHQVVVKQLNEMLNAMLRNNRSESDDEYDFPAILRSKAFYDFTLATAELQRIPFLEMQDAERQVYFINVYNLLFIHAQIVHKLLDLSGGAHFRFFSEMSYQLWGDMYSLNDLQHGLLRSDPARHRRWKGQTKANRALDSPTKWVGALSKRDCRIHFVLFSGNMSRGWVRKQQGSVEVPFIDFAQPDPQLNDAMQTAIIEQTSFNYSRKEIHLPKVFKWYQSDFGQTEGEVLAFVAKFFPEGSAEQNIISNFLTRGKFNTKYKSFNWSSVGLSLAGN